MYEKEREPITTPLRTRDIARLKRPLRLRRDARQMPPLPVLPVNQRRVLRHAIVPHHHRPLLPLDARLEVRAVREVVVQELEDRIRLLLLEPDNVAGNCVCQPPSRQAPSGNSHCGFT